MVERARRDAEFGQALIRFPVSLVAILFAVHYAVPRGGYPAALIVTQLPICAAIYYAIATVLVVLTFRRPGHFVWRRLVGMTIDFAGLVLLLDAAGESALPLAVAAVWLAVGNGIRFGAAYMLTALAGGIGALLLVWSGNPYWRQNPMIGVTLIATLVVAPAYALSLLGTVRRTIARLELAALDRARVLARASHDLRQPLHALGIFSARLGQTRLAPEQRDLLRSIEQSLTNARDLLQTYLDSSIVALGQLAARPSSFPLSTLFAELESQCRPQAERVGVDLRFVPTRLAVRTDRTMLKAVLQNFIANAIRHAPGSRVVIGCRIAGGLIAIQVRDDGASLVRPDPAAPVDDSPSNVGLGLTIVQDLARLAGVTVRKVSVLRGTDVRIEGLERAVGEASSHRDDRFNPLSGKHVVLVQDEGGEDYAIAPLLERWGCRVERLARLPDIATSCDVAVIASRASKPPAAHQLKLIVAPILLLTTAPLPPARRLASAFRVITAGLPVTPAELRSMLMALTQRD